MCQIITPLWTQNKSGINTCGICRIRDCDTIKHIDCSGHKELWNLIKTPSKIIFMFWGQMLWLVSIHALYSGVPRLISWLGEKLLNVVWIFSSFLQANPEVVQVKMPHLPECLFQLVSCSLHWMLYKFDIKSAVSESNRIQRFVIHHAG